MFGIKRKNNDGPSKSFLTVGPVLHYSHTNVHRWWWLTVAVYLCVCLFWSKITTGNLNSLQLQNVKDLDIWSLGYFVVNPVSIFEYPWQILVLGLLMAIISFTPILISQLLSSRYCVLFILMAAFIAKLPALSLYLTISSVAVACRPLRFRSRFISIVLCSSPLLIYWGIFGGFVDIDPVKWGLSYAPWLLAWISGLAICALVLGVGHYTRYKPGVTAIASFIALLIAGFTFFYNISFAESDYNIYVVTNNPEECGDFHYRSVSPIIDKVASEPLLDNDIFMLLSSGDDRIPERNDTTRERLLEELQAMVNINVWPLWFMEQADNKFYDFKSKRNKRIEQLNYFIENHPGNKRMPIALYYKAMLREFLPNPKALKEKETLEYYHNYPRPEVFPDWVKLYRDHPESVESLEARWRIAMNLCRKGDFETATSICRESISLSGKLIKTIRTHSIHSAATFTPPPETTITARELDNILFKTKYLIEFLENNNITDSTSGKRRLSEYLGLNQYSLEYKNNLRALLDNSQENDPLKDNIKLAFAMESSVAIERCKALTKFIEEHKDQDSIIEASYELGLCKVQLWRETEEDSPERLQRLDEARNTLKNITTQYPGSIFSKQAEETLKGLPRQENS